MTARNINGSGYSFLQQQAIADPGRAYGVHTHIRKFSSELLTTIIHCGAYHQIHSKISVYCTHPSTSFSSDHPVRPLRGRAITDNQSITVYLTAQQNHRTFCHRCHQ